MAGMPSSLLNRANEILSHLESKQVDDSNSKTSGHRDKIKTLNNPKFQLSIFDAHSATFEEIRTILDGIDVNRLTPVEALLKLQEIKNKLQ
jgi:DNA mismatch repair protein MutS